MCSFFYMAVSPLGGKKYGKKIYFQWKKVEEIMVTHGESNGEDILGTKTFIIFDIVVKCISSTSLNKK